MSTGQDIGEFLGRVCVNGRKETSRQRQRELNKTRQKAVSGRVLRDLRVWLGHRADGMGERRGLGM